MSGLQSGTDSPAIQASDSQLQSKDLDHVNNALTALQGKDTATHPSGHGARSTPFGAGGLL
jgi:hypothetical protein